MADSTVRNCLTFRWFYCRRHFTRALADPAFRGAERVAASVTGIVSSLVVYVLLRRTPHRQAKNSSQFSRGSSNQQASFHITAN